jgi:hypothetical protein
VAKQEPSRATFTPDEHGSFIPGVPARDLTPDEWAALDKETQKLCLTSKLYAVAPEERPTNG